jgi:hypothetical protein
VNRHYRPAPAEWTPGIRVVYVANDGTGLTGKTGVYEGDSTPLPGVTPRSWLGVLVRFDGEDEPLDVDPADLTTCQPVVSSGGPHA